MTLKKPVWFVLALVLSGSMSPCRLVVRAQDQPGAASASPSAGEACIVTCRRGVDLERLVAEHALTPHHRYHHAINGFAANLLPKTIQGLEHDSRVLAVEPDTPLGLCDSITTYQSTPGGVVRLGVQRFPPARINRIDDDRIDVDVALLDTGIVTNHPELNVVSWVGFTGEGLDGNDLNGHGTKVAGIIGAIDNRAQVVGVAPGVRLWSVQILPTNGVAPWSWFLAGLDYIATNADRIAVVNASIAGSTSTNPITAIQLAVSNVVSRGVVFVAAVGNGGTDIAGSDGVFGTPDDILPAGLPEVMAVSGVFPQTDEFWGASNYSRTSHSPSYVSSPGAAIDVAAPVQTAFVYAPGSFANTGTSFASPHAAGIVALYIALNGRAHSAQEVYRIRQAIVDNSLPQSQWVSYPNTYDQDNNPEPLVVPSTSWIPLPKVESANLTPAGLQIGFATIPGYAHTIQSCTGLVAPNHWVNLYTFNGTGAVRTVTFTDPTVSNGRFYRVARQPIPNLVQDGSFESPAFTNGVGLFPAGSTIAGAWSVSGSYRAVIIPDDYNYSAVSYNPSPQAGDPALGSPEAGRQQIYIGDGLSAMTISQQIPETLRAGATYRLSFYQNIGDPVHTCYQCYAAGKVLVALQSATETFSGLFTKDGDGNGGLLAWQIQTLTFTPTTTATFTLSFQSFAGFTSDIDAVRLEAVSATGP